MKFFISYARTDSGFALKLANALRKNEIQIWIDQLDIHGGRNWDESVQAALSACHAMIAILSPAAVKSTNVMDEISYALTKHKIVIPVLFQECEMPFRLHRRQHIDFRGDFDAALPKLLNAIQNPESTVLEFQPGTTPVLNPTIINKIKNHPAAFVVVVVMALLLLGAISSGKLKTITAFFQKTETHTAAPSPQLIQAPPATVQPTTKPTR